MMASAGIGLIGLIGLACTQAAPSAAPFAPGSTAPTQRAPVPPPPPEAIDPIAPASTPERLASTPSAASHAFEGVQGSTSAQTQIEPPLHALRLDDCEVEIRPVSGAAAVDDWVGLWRALIGPETLEIIVGEVREGDPNPLPASDFEAREALCAGACEGPGIYAVGQRFDFGYGQDLVVAGHIQVDARGGLALVGPREVLWREYHCPPDIDVETAAGRWVLAPVRVEGAGPNGACEAGIDDDCMIGCFYEHLHQRSYVRRANTWFQVDIRHPSAPPFTYADDWAAELTWGADPHQAPTGCSSTKLPPA